jgi:hypothetical protein
MAALVPEIMDDTEQWLLQNLLEETDSVPFITSSRHCEHIRAVTLVVACMQGHELISINHGEKSSPSMKSAPNSSKQFVRLSMCSCDASKAHIMLCRIPG